MKPSEFREGDWSIVDALGCHFLLGVLPSGEFVTLRLVIDRGAGGHDPNGWWWSWNGSLMKPSLRGSIGGESWHGFLNKGAFVERVDDEGGDWW